MLEGKNDEGRRYARAPALLFSIDTKEATNAGKMRLAPISGNEVLRNLLRAGNMRRKNFMGESFFLERTMNNTLCQEKL